MQDRFTIVGLGEALFDLFPDQQRLGGAPLNVAVHARQLGHVRGGGSVVVSRVGQDDLGDTLLEELRHRGVGTDYIQCDPDRPTGRVYVDFEPDGSPRFDIVEDAAWDVLQFDFDLEDLAATCTGVCFGSLAQRDGQSRSTIYRFLDLARRAVRLFDVNLRQNDYDQRIIARSCELATIVKLNHEELAVVAGLLALDGAGKADADAADRQARALGKRYGLDMVVLTRGKAGTRLYTSDGQYEGEPVSYEPIPGAVPGADPVGAGDACAAAVLVGRVLRMPPERIVNLANHCGAYVASQPGATPELPAEILEMVKG